MFKRIKRNNAGSEEIVEPTNYDELSPVFRLVSLYEIALHDEWKYVKLYCPAPKKPLRNGVYLGVGIEALRAIIALIILILLIVHRLKLMPNIDGSNAEAISTISKLLYYWSAFTLVIFFIIVIQLASYYTQTSSMIVTSTCLNFVGSLIVISLLFLIALYLNNDENIIKDAIFKNVLSKGSLDPVQKSMGCCGFENYDDFREPFLLKYSDPLTFKKIEHPNDLYWTVKYSDFILTVPDSCCFRPREQKTIHLSCAHQNVSDIGELRRYYNDNDYLQLFRLLNNPKGLPIYDRGCVEIFVESFGNYSKYLIILLIIFAILTAISIGFVICFLLYNDGIGQILNKTTLFDVSRNTGVHFLMSLDGGDRPFHDEFSLIEYLRETDIDKIVIEAPQPERKRNDL